MYSLKNNFKKALVTGGAGFVGSHLVDSLLADGLTVVSIDNYVSGKHENLENARKYPNFMEVNCDITDLNTLKKYFTDVDIVFNLAASKMTVCLQNPALDLEVNAKGTFNVLECSKMYKVKKVVHASTGSVYGKAQYYPTDEKHSFSPASYYGVSKLAGERYAKVFQELYDLDVSILRYYHVYGPRQESSDIGGVVSIFGRRALKNLPLYIYGDGSQIRSFTYVKDLVDLNKLIALTPTSKGEAYNCASGNKITITELAEFVVQFFNKKLDIIHKEWKAGDIKYFDVSNEKVKSLGFNFATSFAHGLNETLEWVQEHCKGEEYDQC